MILRLGYDIQFELPAPAAIVALLNVHPSRVADLRAPDELRVEPAAQTDTFIDSFGNRCVRFLAQQGPLRLSNSTLVYDTGEPDRQNFDAREIPVQKLPHEALRYLYSSRYCEVDRFSTIALELFGAVPPGYSRVQAVCDWVHTRVIFGYQHARPTKTAMDVYNERAGVCRDFTHLAVTFMRAMNIPARYATGYLGDIGVTPDQAPMDFSAWFEAFAGGRWFTFDARHNRPRIGRIVMARGRDAADVAISTSFGRTRLAQFAVLTEELLEKPESASYERVRSVA